MNHIHNPDWQTIDPFTTPHGEVVREMAGHSAGGLQAHSLAHITLPPGKASRRHYHPEAEESYFILTGTARVIVDGETVLLQPGQILALQPPQVHQIFNDSQHEPLTFLAVCVPPWTPDCSVFLDEADENKNR